MDEILWLGRDDVTGLGLCPDRVREAVGEVFREKSRGETKLLPKLSLDIAPGEVAQALVGAVPSAVTSGVKWIGVSAGNAARGLPNIHALVVLSNSTTGIPRAIMDGSWITAVRTAACTALAAAALARTTVRRIGFVGCGLQARAHLDALLAVRPGLREAVVFGRSQASFETFRAHAEALGVAVRRTERSEETVEGMDVVVSSVPPAAGLRPFLDPRRLAPGSFVGAVDLGRTWFPDHWRESFDVVATDDLVQSEAIGRAGKMVSAGPFDAEIGDLSLGRHPGRRSDDERTALLFAGIALADLAVAILIEREARARGIGRFLPL